ncbi:MAG: penicillin-binding protein 2 [Anaerolineaceae bacterium]
MNNNQYQKPTIDLGRFKWIYILLGAVILYYIYQLFNYQIINGEAYRTQAEDNRTQEISDPTQRGMIFDRNGVILARNIPSYNITVTPANLPDAEGEVRKIYAELSELIDIPVSNGVVDDAIASSFTPCYTDLGIEQIVYIADTNWPYEATRLKCDVTKEVAMAIKEKSMDWPGIGVEIESIREYPTGNITSELVGFLGPVPEALVDYYTELGFVSGRDKVGYAGVESTMQDVLGGTNGKRVVEVNVGGEVLRNLEEPIEPVPGQNVYLTIDTRLQSAARDALILNLDYWNRYVGYTLSNSGSVIALDAKTGEVLAMVSYPNIENNRMSSYIPGYYYEQLSLDAAKPLVNQAISAELPPGSVYKLATALGVLNEGVVTPEYIIEDPGSITVIQKYYENDPGRPQIYYCWDENGHGPVDFLHAIAWSCNIYWHKVAGGFPGEVEDGGLGILRMDEYAKALGYGTLTGIELPGEADGLLPDPTWKRLNLGENWATGDTYLAAIGQGYVLATPLQVVNSIATIANDGKHMQVSLIKKVVASDGTITQEFEPTVLWDITTDPVITVYDENVPTDEKITVQPWVIELAKRGMQMVTQTGGTAAAEFEGDDNKVAGKTGTAEYCDDIARENKLCGEGIGGWPAHAWFVGYAPYDDPEIVVVAFSYNGKEGSTLAAPIVRKVIDVYFELKEADADAFVTHGQ